MMSQAEQRENNKPKSIKLTFSYKTANAMLFIRTEYCTFADIFISRESCGHNGQQHLFSYIQKRYFRY